MYVGSCYNKTNFYLNSRKRCSVMNTPNKRKDTCNENPAPKRVKKECSYGENCYRRNPAHFREFCHPHLERILDEHREGQDYPIPTKYSLQKQSIIEQLDIIVEKQLYAPTSEKNTENIVEIKENREIIAKEIPKLESDSQPIVERKESRSPSTVGKKVEVTKEDVKKDIEKKDVKMEASGSKEKDSDYRPIVEPTRNIKEFLKVVVQKGKMAAKHDASAPYHIFYTAITDARETHSQPYSITFQEILDSSLGELKCSLQINFMVEIGWLLAQYYFAGYSNKRLTILYEEDCTGDLKSINKKRPNVEAHHVTMPSPFGKHHTKMMLLCYEDGSLRVVVSTANLYLDDWENRTQGLWFSPRCPELPSTAMPHEGESPTMFKRSLLKYLNHYHLPQLSYYVERVKRCDFTRINVFLVTSTPGGHFDDEFGLKRVSSLLRQHCDIDASSLRQWPVIAQASSLGSYGKAPQLWLTGDFLHSFIKVKNQPQSLMQPPELKLIYPSLENVRQSHDNLLGGGCLPYSAELHTKQTWIKDYMFQWRARHSGRDKAMPHIKSYTRLSPCGKMAAFYLLTSANVSKAAWGQINKGNGALRIMSYEAGVMFLPKFIINRSHFPLEASVPDRLVIPYDLPPTKYMQDMSPWVQDYLR